jgi:hypothetical protein
MASGPQRAGSRRTGRRATAGLGRKSEPGSSLRMGLTSGSRLAAREEGEKRGGGGWAARKETGRGRPAWAGPCGGKEGRGRKREKWAGPKGERKKEKGFKK